MNDEQMTTSAALFFRPEQGTSVPFAWFERARDVLTEHGLSPILFTAYGGEFLHDDCYVLAKRGGDLTMWGELLPARQEELLGTLRSGEIEILGLDSPRPGARNRSDWRANVSAYARSGECYVGIDDKLDPDPVALIHRAWSITKEFFAVRYGIAYRMPLAEEPECYAGGTGRYSLADFREELRQRHEGIRRQKTPDDLWADELNGQRRHLSGLFRGAYPASVLSESHVRAADLTSHPVGKLSQLATSLWLWELSAAEIPTAQQMLHDKGLLVSQAGQP